MLDWLRDSTEAEMYGELSVTLVQGKHVGDYKVFLSKGKKLSDYLTWGYNFVGWMPIDCAHYNQWKVEREARPRCNVCGKYADGFPDGWIGGISSPWICPECRNKPCCATCGTECDTSHYAYANCGVMIGEYKMWTPIKPACNGTGTVSKEGNDND